MPELPEVETARRLLDAALTGQILAEVTCAPDEIVFKRANLEALRDNLRHQVVRGTGRKGKFMWLKFDAGALILHLGMSGAILELTPGSERSVHYVNGKHEVVAGQPPRFLKLRLLTESGRDVAMVDGRRLARIGWAAQIDQDPQIQALGPDAYTELPSPEELGLLLVKRTAPIKALLLNQSILSGLGNYLADEILYHAAIAPSRPAGSLDAGEIERLHTQTEIILRTAIEAEADEKRYPQDWLFHARWGGSRGEAVWQGQALVRETIGGRTTAWVPERQR